MEIIWTRTRSIVSLCIIALVSGGWAVKHFWFPKVDDKFFQLDRARLKSAPDNLFVFRETHFGESRRAGTQIGYSSSESSSRAPENLRLLARNASMAEIVALAYDCPPSRVVLPFGAPTNTFDLLITKSDARIRLKKHLESKFNYKADWKEQETVILALQVKTPNAPGLQLSTNATNSGTDYWTHKIRFRHAQIGQLLRFIETVFIKPVEDQTRLKDHYNFEIGWDWGSSSASSRELLNKSLTEMGLTLGQDVALMRMMVVTQGK